ncbi:putative beta-galactoside alpha-2,6-sialyltransferase 1 [Phascolarctid gammaherpesvirus 1]|uniref:beta-galactoside alpha-(2,6)-sialyltransferase n=1 Tax=Phascolarctid gammaherpesvirus 1 TaxID=2249313 RepID=A0A3S8D7R5_9GAMA|nr:putative beta-galactoside alpha-2,6-sialyltransferase 1 [Phascolarctid gammaherpesvirus 1]AZB49179.1 putative beta-galactoside alpha-2,6-sialyltransferase 1 [Phascolarctid gammaherpesvirus 1]
MSHQLKSRGISRPLRRYCTGIRVLALIGGCILIWFVHVLSSPGHGNGDTHKPGPEVLHDSSAMQWWARFLGSGMGPRLTSIKDGHIEKNKYGVPSKVDIGLNMNKDEVMCKIQGILDAFISKREGPFRAANWSQYLPFGNMIFDKIQEKTTCAVVSSAGSMRGSGFGKDIDGHDLILRFNDAPTEGYEVDVGNKTTLRLLNSQVFVKRKNFFFNSQQNLGQQFIIWDPTKYNANLSEWYTKPEFDFFSQFREWVDSMIGKEAFILHPGFLWKVWTVIQAFNTEKIQPHPPSSGSIGVALLMNVCQKIDLYGFLSVEIRELCHYYDDSIHDPACTFGAYHPLIFEKKMWAFIAQQSMIEKHRDKLTIFPNDPAYCIKPMSSYPLRSLWDIWYKLFPVKLHKGD